MLVRIQVAQCILISDAVNSAIGRLGIGIGKEANNSNVFLKAALAHEFSGKMKSTYSMAGEPTTNSVVDLKDTWLDAEIGGSLEHSS